jgi:antitoxin component of RelBE/YafQ-DinJ toxin-antitoxin module
MVKSQGIAVSVRLDSEAARALKILESAGMTRSEAIRISLLEAAQKARHHNQIRLEVAALAADETDRKEMLEIAQFMSSLHE